MNADSPVTNRIGSLLYLWGTPLQLNDSELARQELQATNLMTSSNRSWVEPYSDGIVPGSYFNESNKEFLGPQPLAVMLSGTFPDAFQGRSMPEWPAKPGAEDNPDETQQPPAAEDIVAGLNPQATKVVLVGCAKMFDDAIIQAGQNALFFLNSVDGLAHGEDLISIRTKMLTQRVIKPVSDSQKLFWRLFVTILVPVLLVIYGVVRAASRRKEAALYRQQLALQSKSHA